MSPSATFFLINITNKVLVFFHDDVGLTWGLAIIALTFLIRLLILPLSIKQIRSMRAMSSLQPQLKEIQERYKDDRERLQREMMDVYKRNGVNPFASCLPLLLQLPFFLAILYTLRSSSFKADLGAVNGDPGAGWGFIKALAQAAHGSELVILVVLYVGTQLVAGLIMTGANASRQQRMISLGLPLLFAPIIVGFPAGVVLYWITSNVWTMGQQAVVKLVFPPEEPPSVEEVQAAKPPPPPPRKKKRRR
ncbi:MAG: YidC/Oxa1 family membrane protein insertase [Solirubrobacterales bacterium]